MPLSPELKEILACPKCKGPLEFHEEAARSSAGPAGSSTGSRTASR